ncbi:MAG TPA: hypothetical protein VFQ06_13655 [Nitrospira sp.]|nr:hypothetical protein [Nitrospira sp.]
MPDERSTSRALRIREWIQFGILIFATAWGVYTFIFRDVLRPAQRPSALELTTTLQEIGQAAGYRLIQVRIVSANPTDRRIYIPALWYTVWGRTIGKRDPVGFLGAVDSAPRGTVTARHAEITGNEVVASGRIYIENATWYDPRDKTTEEDVFAVPVRLYDFLVLKVEYFATRDTVGSGPPQWELQPDGSWSPTLPNISEHWERKSGAQYNWSVATLSLWPKTQ